MSTAIMQVMACGLPIIASDVMGVNNMIDNGVNGILAPVNDAPTLAHTIQHILENATLRQKLAENAYQFATTHYSNKRMFESYQHIFESSTKI